MTEDKEKKELLADMKLMAKTAGYASVAVA